MLHKLSGEKCISEALVRANLSVLCCLEAHIMWSLDTEEADLYQMLWLELQVSSYSEINLSSTCKAVMSEHELTGYLHAQHTQLLMETWRTAVSGIAGSANMVPDFIENIWSKLVWNNSQSFRELATARIILFSKSRLQLPVTGHSLCFYFLRINVLAHGKL